MSRTVNRSTSSSQRGRIRAIECIRRNERTPVDWPVVVVTHWGERAGICRDIALGGMRVTTDAQLSYSDDVVVLVDASGAPAIGLVATELRLPATVRWRDSIGIGLQFGLLGAGETRCLLWLIQRSSDGANWTPVDLASVAPERG